MASRYEFDGWQQAEVLTEITREVFCEDGNAVAAWYLISATFATEQIRLEASRVEIGFNIHPVHPFGMSSCRNHGHLG
jgi:hypothetical protein